jgi:hypothetical protein
MKNVSILLIFSLLYINNLHAQIKINKDDELKIKSVVVNFLNWHKNGEPDSTSVKYSLTKNGYPDSTTKTLIDFNGVEIQLEQLKRSGFISDTFINNLRQYFVEVNKILEKRNLSPDLLRIPELDDDYILKTIEPSEVLDKISQGRFDKIQIRADKAIAGFKISKQAIMIFTLTKIKNSWKIDYIGWDTSYENSIALQ